MAAFGIAWYTSYVKSSNANERRPAMLSKTKEIEGSKRQATIGSVIMLDTGRVEQLLDCDDWDRADFRFPNPVQGWEVSHAIACNVHITGRTIKFNASTGDFHVRVQIEWVRDDEPSTFSGGWMFV